MWNDLPPEYLVHVAYFDKVMCGIRENDPESLPLLALSQTLMVASDFTGAQSRSRFETLSFVLVPVEGVAHWNEHRKWLREHYRLRNRRISYAKLTDSRKRAALFGFLHLANAISALSVTILIDKRIKSLFKEDGLLVPTEVDIAGKHFDRWKPRVFERVLRAAHLIGVFVAGLCGRGQDITWITDEDEIAPNVAALTDLTHVFAFTLGSMLPHDIGHIRVGTTGTTAGDDLAMEDFAAISDLVAGAVNDFICGYGPDMRLSKIVVTAPSHLSPKTYSLIAALFDSRAPLRKLVFVLDQPDESRRIRYTQLRIHQQPGIVIPGVGSR